MFLKYTYVCVLDYAYFSISASKELNGIKMQKKKYFVQAKYTSL